MLAEPGWNGGSEGLVSEIWAQEDGIGSGGLQSVKTRVN